MTLDHRQLGYVVALSETGSFTEAARVLHVAQPAVSQVIRSIERRVGVEVFDRRARRLTEAGEILARRGRRAQAELDAANDEILALTDVRSGHLRVGAIHWLAPFDLAGVLGRFRSTHPGVRITLQEDDADVMLDRLQDGALDIVMHNEGPGTDRPGTGRKVVTAERIVAVVAPDDPWAGRSRVSMADVAERDVITFRSGSALRSLVDHAFESAGTPLRVALESSDLLSAGSLAAAGLGVGIVPASVANAMTVACTAVTIAPAIERRVLLVWRTDHDPAPAVSAFMDAVRATDD